MTLKETVSSFPFFLQKLGVDWSRLYIGLASSLGLFSCVFLYVHVSNVLTVI